MTLSFMNKNLLIAAAMLVCHAAWAAPGRVELETSMGRVVIELDAGKAPKTVENFLRYVDSGFYNDTVFHRVVDGYLVQGGGYIRGLKQKAGFDPIVLESKASPKNLRGSVAMARIHTKRNSARSQFFINLVDNAALDTTAGGYIVFGRVVEGMEIVDAMATVPVGSMGRHQHMPKTPLVLKRAERVREAPVPEDDPCNTACPNAVDVMMRGFKEKQPERFDAAALAGLRPTALKECLDSCRATPKLAECYAGAKTTGALKACGQ